MNGGGDEIIKSMYGDALTTKARIKDRLQITATTFDDLLDNLILSVTKRISQMCNRRFTQATFTQELHDGCDTYGYPRHSLILKNAPVQSIATIEYKTGLNSNPAWTAYDEDDYDVDMQLGVLTFKSHMPVGKQNIRVTYTAGFSGFSIGVMTYWNFNVVPSGAVNGSNLTFTLPEDATELIVYADGIRLLSSNVTFVSGSDSFTLAAGQAPYSSIAVDYLPEVADADSENWLPADLVEVAEEVVIRLFKRRDSEGRTSEGFNESQITWSEGVYTKENLATIKNYRRGYYL